MIGAISAAWAGTDIEAKATLIKIMTNIVYFSIRILLSLNVICIFELASSAQRFVFYFDTKYVGLEESQILEGSWDSGLKPLLVLCTTNKLQYSAQGLKGFCERH
jgi:hypothetical protein